MESELQRVARRLVECLDQVPEAAGQLREAAHLCRQKAVLVGQLAGGDPQGRRIVAKLDDAARRCEEAADRCLKAHQPGRDWAMEKVGGTQAGADHGDDRNQGGRAAGRPAGLDDTDVPDRGDGDASDRLQPASDEASEVLKRRDPSSRYESALDWAKSADTIGNLKDAGETWVRIGEKTWAALKDEPGPAAALVRTDGPVISQARRDDLRGGELLIAPVVLWLLGDAVARWANARMAERKQSRGSRDHAGD